MNGRDGKQLTDKTERIKMLITGKLTEGKKNSEKNESKKRRRKKKKHKEKEEE